MNEEGGTFVRVKWFLQRKSGALKTVCFRYGLSDQLFKKCGMWHNEQPEASMSKHDNRGTQILQASSKTVLDVLMNAIKSLIAL